MLRLQEPGDAPPQGLSSLANMKAHTACMIRAKHLSCLPFFQLFFLCLTTNTHAGKLCENKQTNTQPTTPLATLDPVLSFPQLCRQHQTLCLSRWVYTYSRARICSWLDLAESRGTRALAASSSLRFLCAAWRCKHKMNQPSTHIQ